MAGWFIAMVCCMSQAQEPTTTSATTHAAFFRDEVAPILKQRCFECHSHSSGVMEGGLALDWRSGWELGGSRGPAIRPGNPESSLLMRAVRHEDPKLQMPEEKLPSGEIEILAKWIKQGAFDDRVGAPKPDDQGDTDWWSLRPLVRPDVPLQTRNPIDAFILSRLREHGLEPTPRADRRALIRRVSYDLTGLPPTPQEVDMFVADLDDHAYEKLVDRLLASQRYGERWARHWFDTIHFADSHGYEHDIGRDHAWRYRDYMIESLNQDKPWSRLIREQLAADYFYPDHTNLIPALGFLGAGTFDFSTYSTATVTFEYLDRDDLVTQTMAAFSSTTANCARCHAHKFDPISQEDYYCLQAVFAGVLKGDVAFDPNPETAKERSRLQRLIDAAEKRDPTVLLQPSHLKEVRAWLDDQSQQATWHALKLRSFVSIEGSTLSLTNAQTILASGTRPDKDTYVVSASLPDQFKELTALRLDVLPHDSLPMKGPGRCDNGNLHLSEFELQVFEPSSPQSRSLKIKNATADFNQAAWGIERAMDGDPKTAWGIHPAVGQPHYAVFELAEPLTVTPETTLTVTLRQLHGGSHLIGALALSVTEHATPVTAIPFEVAQIISKPENDRNTQDQLAIAAHVIKVNAQRQLLSLPPRVSVYAAGRSVGIPEGEGKVQLKTIEVPKVVHILHRGDFDKPQQVVVPGALSALRSLNGRFHLDSSSPESARRAALADWLAQPDNVLTWRSIANRVWHYHFGRGICDTPSDFGRMGGVPSHPELLDWLSIWFRDEAHGSLKSLHRLIVTSDTYCQASTTHPQAQQIDGENRWLWRQNRQRLDADAIRDFTLAASGCLDLTMGGPSVQHFKQSKGPQATPALDYRAFDWSGPGAGRRSIYRYVWRGIADPFMEAIDFPDLGLLAPTRSFSASSLQALTLYNNDFILHHSQAMAKDVASDRQEVEHQVTECVRRVWLRAPSSDERAIFSNFVRQHSLAELCRLLFNSNAYLFVD
jgi:hypothetical protein